MLAGRGIPQFVAMPLADSPSAVELVAENEAFEGAADATGL
jgi:hypothetical protein